MEDNFAVGYAMGADSAGSRSNNNDGGFGGANSWIWIIVVFALLFGWGNNGSGNRGGGSGNSGGGDSMAAFLPYIAGSVTGGGALTRGELCQDMNFADVQNGVRNISDSVNTGFANLNSTICHQQYDTAMMINGVTAAVNNGFSGLNSTICQQQYDTAAQLNAMNIANMQNQNALQTQIAQCCCENREGQAQIRYDMATNACAIQNTIQNTTRDIIDSQNAGTRAILDKMCQQELAAKDAQIAAQTQRIFGLELAASQAAQNNYIINTLRPPAVPAYPASSPCGLGNWAPQVLANGYGFNGGNCGCCA